MIQASRASLLAVLIALPLLGADCAGDGSGGAKDTGLDKAGSQGGGPEPEPFKPRQFSGNGTTNIGTVKVTEDAILEWTNEGQYRFFSVYDDGFSLNISSEAASGNSVVPPGTYENIQVAGNQWTMTIRPR